MLVFLLCVDGEGAASMEASAWPPVALLCRGLPWLVLLEVCGHTSLAPLDASMEEHSVKPHHFPST